MSDRPFTNLHQEQRRAKSAGFDKAKFLALFPSGPRQCTWLDAYMGLFRIDGLEGFVAVNSIDAQLPDLQCIPLSEAED